MQRAPTAAGQMLLALDRYLGPSHELVLVGDLARDDTKDAIAAVHRRYLPRAVIAARDSKSVDRRLALAASRRALRRQRIARRPAGAVRLPELRLPGAGRGSGGNRIAARCSQSQSRVGIAHQCLHGRRNNGGQCPPYLSVGFVASLADDQHQKNRQHLNRRRHSWSRTWLHDAATTSRRVKSDPLRCSPASNW